MEFVHYATVSYESMRQYHENIDAQRLHLIHLLYDIAWGSQMVTVPRVFTGDTKSTMYGVVRTTNLPSLPEWRAGEIDGQLQDRKSLALFDWVFAYALSSRKCWR